ncbi:RagB/SusD family nutrient uptake outer membrane protein [Parapedobacter soli]|uniref:RagB/SusD family nutrient uptake outer membrane protein n=1 Tax=Parapedobacter soli TaxID=416955 RepID=UPI0021CAD324|nr:RagB/SusD family nutrient uptake outer membrane protein [Parapedobacter soli]
MYKLIVVSSFLVAIVTFTSCEKFLTEVPKSQISPENYYTTAADAEAAVIGAYNALQRNGVYGGGPTMQIFVSDIVRTAATNTFGGIGNYTITADNTEVLLLIWTNHYRGINDANTAIDCIPSIKMAEKRKNTLVAEAKFLRSLLYFNLIRIWGDVPYKVSQTNSLNNLHVPRTPIDTIYNGIIHDLEFGIEHLDVKGETQAGRATVGAAKTLLANVYLTRGSMAKRDGVGDGLTDFQKAAQLAKDVITTNHYSLCQYFPDAFIPENKNNDEIIFDVQYKSGGFNEGSNLGINMGLMGPNLLGGSFGGIHATEYFHTIYENTDLVRKEWTTPHVRVEGDGTLKTDFPEDHAQPWKIGKFRRFPVRKADYVPNDYDIHFPIFRLAEVYLIYAEALNEANKDLAPPSEIYMALNKLRERARYTNKGTIHQDLLPRELTYNDQILPDITEHDYPDYASVKQYIIYERARELGGECKRWFDLVRWGKLVEYVKLLKNFKPEGRRAPERNWAIIADNIQDKHVLMPIPTSEIHANALVTQNKGY